MTAFYWDESQNIHFIESVLEVFIHNMWRGRNYYYQFIYQNSQLFFFSSNIHWKKKKKLNHMTVETQHECVSKMILFYETPLGNNLFSFTRFWAWNSIQEKKTHTKNENRCFHLVGSTTDIFSKVHVPPTDCFPLQILYWMEMYCLPVFFSSSVSFAPALNK